MGFYIRKAISVGPFRFNLSKSGVGLSTGVRGLRVGTGPRGNYVHMGRHGLYYRQTLPSGEQREHVPQPSQRPRYEHDVQMEEITSGDTTAMTDTSSRELLQEINEKKSRLLSWPIALLLTVILLFVVPAGWTRWVVIILGATSAGAAAYWDLLRKTVVVFYELEGDIEQAYDTFHDWAFALAKSQRAWHIAARGRLRDPRYHAGAQESFDRKPTTIKKSAPSYFKTNIAIVQMAAGRQTLYFFPDRILVYSGSGVGAVSWSDLHLTIRESRFVEDEALPSDARVVDRTWRYVNKNGGPDRRFKDNSELPVCLYTEFHFHSSSGLNEMIQVSRSDVGEGFGKAVARMKDGNVGMKESRK